MINVVIGFVFKGLIMLKIGIFDGANVKLKDVVSFEQIEKLLKLDEPLSSGDILFFQRISRKGDTVFIAVNPYISELDRRNVIMYDMDLEKLRNDFHTMKDDI